MIRHFFLDKTNTIIENSFQNLGLNPILGVGYGKFLMRGLLHFDILKIKELIDDKTFADTSKLKFTLKMTNCFSVDSVPYKNKMNISPDFRFDRASSFDLMLFKLDEDFDMGRGFDYTDDLYIKNRVSFSEEGSNWYFAKKCVPWRYERDKFDLNMPMLGGRYYDRKRADYISGEVIEIAEKFENDEMEIEEVIKRLEILATKKYLNSTSMKGGIYDKEFLINEYEKFMAGEKSIIVGIQHFDFGSEGLSIDVTDYIIDELNSNCIKNYGLCLAFTPYYESIGTEYEQYVGFFNDNTNTFFHPYIEAVYDEYIMDDRESFTVGRENKLYLYVFDDSIPTNLDKLPTCEIDGNEFEVKQATKGVYFASVSGFTPEMEVGMIYNDKWSEIELNGVSEDDVELEFSTRPKSHKLQIGSNSYSKSQLVPTPYGINYGEQVKRGLEREVVIDFREKFSTDKMKLVSNAEYRIYVLDGVKELDIIPYTKVEKSYLNNFFKVYTEDLIPNKYYVDIKVNDGREIRVFEKILMFEIVSDVTERYE
jgi:hypothetical protein